MKDFKIVRLPKGNGSFRTIYAPSLEYKKILRKELGYLNNIAQKSDIYNVSHAFSKHKSIVTNAKPHIGHRFTLKMDLTNFFDSVTEKHVANLVRKETIKICFIDGIARQGLPTSPALANIAFAKADKRMVDGFKKKDWQIVYTRYADDLTFSWDDDNIKLKDLFSFVKQIVKRNGFSVNEAKTKLQDSRNGRIIIAGVSVGKEDIKAPRKAKRKLRAMKHQKNENAIKGIKGYINMVEPETKYKSVAKDNIKKFSNNFNLKISQKMIKKVEKKPTEILENNIIISGDSLQMAGMSIWTTGWTSCMGKGGSHAKGVSTWIECKNTRIAYLTNKTMELFKIERDKMIVRCLVHKLANGVEIYDKIYPNSNSKEADILKETLLNNNIISINKAKKLYPNMKVGYVSAKRNVWADNVKFTKVKLTTGKKVYRISL